MVGFFDLPRELRETIYREVFTTWMRTTFIVPPWVEDDGESEIQRDFAQSYELLRTCRQFYDEGSAIFWALREVELHAEPVQFRPWLRDCAPYRRDKYALGELGEWIARTGIRSIRSRRKVKQLCMEVWRPEVPAEYEYDPWEDPDWWKRDPGDAQYLVQRKPNWWRDDCTCNPCRAGLDGLENVEKLILRFDPWTLLLSAIPNLEDVPKLTRLQSVHPSSNAMSMIKAARTVKRSTMTKLQYLIPRLPGLRTVVLEAPVNKAAQGLKWFGMELEPLSSDEVFFMSLQDILRKANITLQVDMKPIDEPYCPLCFGDWTAGHWSPQTPNGECPERSDMGPNADLFYELDHFNPREDGIYLVMGRSCFCTLAVSLAVIVLCLASLVKERLDELPPVDEAVLRPAVICTVMSETGCFFEPSWRKV